MIEIKAISVCTCPVYKSSSSANIPVPIQTGPSSATVHVSQAYQEVNEIFALKTMEAVRQMNKERMDAANGGGRLGPTPIVWIHDYHLMLAANTLR